MRIFLRIAACFVFLAQGLVAQSAISAGRAIEVQLKGVPAEEMALVSGTYTVSDSGMISLPLLAAPVRAAGMSPTSLARSIEAAYRAEKIYTTPTINVISDSDATIAALELTVGGQAKRPGPVKYTRGLTLYNAVQAAGGATEFGSMKRVRVIRGGQLKQYDLTQTKFMNIPVEPNDTIEIPHKTWTNQ